MDLVVGEERLLLHPLSREGALIETGEMKCLERRERESKKETPSFLLKKKLSRNLREKKTPHFFALPFSFSGGAAKEGGK